MRGVGRKTVAVGVVCMSIMSAGAITAQEIARFEIVGDAITAPLAGLVGDAARGRPLAFDPERGNCTICHPVPGGDPRGQGDVGPTLAGVGARLGEGQIRLRVVDGTRINPETIMPPFHRVAGLNRVGAKWAGKPVLSAQEVEDIVAFLMTLKP
jgi:sulfur-oxidizing protein SoxX